MTSPVKAGRSELPASTSYQELCPERWCINTRRWTRVPWRS